MKLAIEKLTSSGYVYIGMDHFAKYDDELAVAQREGGLYRNFQGYSTHSHCDMLALGISAISMLGDSFSQNVKTENEYFEKIDAGQLPVYRGYALSDDDRLRRAVITGLICHFQLTLAEIEQAFNIDFWQYFANERQILEGMAKDGLLQLNQSEIQVSPRGKLLIRNICMVFDAYLKQHASEERFSKTI
jgi:oxygen-independent coproporphyrinogen-3 oxidase